MNYRLTLTSLEYGSVRYLGMYIHTVRDLQSRCRFVDIDTTSSGGVFDDSSTRTGE